MEYTIQKLALLSGISTRTLRYYDEIGLLKPLRISSSGYRIYGETEVNILQQILFYRELGIELEAIKRIISSQSFNPIEALKSHREKLLEKKERIEILIKNVEQSIKREERNIKMEDKNKFNGFKQKLVTDNENQYGKEVRSKYGDKVVDKSNKKVLNMTKEDYDEVENLSKELMATLKEAMKEGNPNSPLAQKAAELHRKWLCYYWSDYSKEAHLSLTEMYVTDKRFKNYYDNEVEGTAAFLRDAVKIYTSK